MDYMLNGLGKHSILTDEERKQYNDECIQDQKDKNKEIKEAKIAYMPICKYNERDKMFSVIDHNGYYASVVLSHQWTKNNPDKVLKLKNNKKYVCYVTENGYLIKVEL